MQAIIRGSDLPLAELRALIRQGRLRRVARGVYACCPDDEPPRSGAQAWRTEVAASLLSVGRGAAASRSTAAALWCCDGFEPPVPIELNAGRAASHRREGLHRVQPIEAPIFVDGISVTGIGQTLLELGAGLAPRRPSASDPNILRPDELVELAVESALRHGAVEEADLLDLLARHPRHAGAAVLDRVLARRPYGAPPTESYLETRGIQVLRNAGRSRGERQVDCYDRRGEYIKRVDLVLNGRVVIEFDGKDHHRDFTGDRVIWAKLAAVGLIVVPVSYELVIHQPRGFIGAVDDALNGPNWA